MKDAIIGRSVEKKILNRLLQSEKTEFLALYGRRRVGKTFLISEFFTDKGIFFEIIGSKNTTNEINLARFCTEISYKFYNGKKRVVAQNWEEAFIELISGIDYNITNNDTQNRIIIFFDELPWIDKSCPDFLGTLDYYWNKFFSKTKYKNVLFIVCGSAASWMIRKIINNKGGLHNRITQTIRLLPFTLEETNVYLKSKDIFLDKKQIVELYMSIGGIPFYLSLIEKGQSSTQIINNLCFQKDGFLFSEFHRLFSSLFDNHLKHLKVIQALSSVKKGMNRKDILKKAALPNGGDSTEILNELEAAGFISTLQNFGKKKKGSIYRLTDEYSLFYINWIEPVKEKISLASTTNYWMQKRNSAVWNAWAGYAFEGICLKHIHKIKAALGISGVLTYESAWDYRPKRDSDEKGAQIDLIIERADHTINLCEIKFYQDQFIISNPYLELLKQKKELFLNITRTKNQIFQTMISIHGVKENENYISAVDNQITIDSLF